MEITVKLGGIEYNVEIDVEDNYVSGVESVQVDTGLGHLQDIIMPRPNLEQFFERYEDDLNDAYQAHLVATAEMNAEEKWELAEDR